jgi:hypothetical protein
MESPIAIGATETPARPSWRKPEYSEIRLEELEERADLGIAFACNQPGLWCDAV